MATAVVGDAAVTLRGKEKHLPFPGVSVQRPAMAEYNWLTGAPIFVIDLGSVFCGDRAHADDFNTRRAFENWTLVGKPSLTKERVRYGLTSMDYSNRQSPFEFATHTGRCIDCVSGALGLNRFCIHHSWLRFYRAESQPEKRKWELKSSEKMWRLYSPSISLRSQARENVQCFFAMEMVIPSACEASSLVIPPKYRNLTTSA